MRNTLEDAIVGDAFSIPLSSASVFIVGLRDFPTICEKPHLTKEAARGIFKLAMIGKKARSPQMAQEEAARAAMLDPEVQSGLDYKQAVAERDQLEQQLQQAQAQLQQLQQVSQAADQRAVQAEQQGQTLQQQNQELQQQAMQEQQGRQAASMHAMQATDAAIASQAAHQQQRMALAAEVDQMALRLKQLVSTDPAAQQQAQQAAMSAQGATGGAPPPNAPPQQMPPDQAAMQQQGGMPPEAMAQQGGMPPQQVKQGSDSFQRMMSRIRLEKEAAIPPRLMKSIAGAGVGATALGTLGALSAAGKRDSGSPTLIESELAHKLQASIEEGKNKPSYFNKLRTATLMRDYNVERAGREHPGGEVARRAVQGAIAGGMAGPAVAYGGGKLITHLAKKFPRAAAKIVK